MKNAIAAAFFIIWLAPGDVQQLRARQITVKAQIDECKRRAITLWGLQNTMPKRRYIAEFVEIKAQQNYLEQANRLLHLQIMGLEQLNANASAEWAKSNEKSSANAQMSSLSAERDAVIQSFAEGNALSDTEAKLVLAFRASDWATVLSIVSFHIRLKVSGGSIARKLGRLERAEFEAMMQNSAMSESAMTAKGGDQPDDNPDSRQCGADRRGAAEAGE